MPWAVQGGGNSGLGTRTPGIPREPLSAPRLMETDPGGWGRGGSGMFWHTWVQWGFFAFWGLSLPQFQTLARDGSGPCPGGSCSSCAAPGQKFQRDLGQAELGFLYLCVPR